MRWYLSCEGQQCKATALSANHAGKHSKDRFKGVVFIDTLAGKLNMWLCMSERICQLHDNILYIHIYFVIYIYYIATIF